MLPICTSRRSALLVLSGLLCLAHVSAMARDEWPAKPIHLVVPFSAGGAADTVTRSIAQALGSELKQTIVVDNKAGAGGLIGSEFVAKSAPDGYTLLIAGNGIIANGLLRARMPYGEADLVPVVSTHTSPSVIVASSSSSFTDLKELQSYARRKGFLTFGTAGAGSTGHFVAEMVQTALGVPITIVHYKSGSETVNALLGQQIDMASEAPIGVKGFIAAGKLRAIGVTGEKRSAALPAVPTTAEQGFPSISIQHWGGLFAPKGTPPAILDRVASALATAAQTEPELRAQFAATGNELMVGTRHDFEQFIVTEKKRLGKLVIDTKMSLD